jgi:HPt (histidine-containing phosphotransfer) domain-containing protein
VDLDQLRQLLARVFGCAPTPPALPLTELPSGISPEEWPQLRERIIDDMQRELDMVHDELMQRNTTRAWQAAHRIVGTARWFRLAGVASSASALQKALDEHRVPNVEIEALKTAIDEFAKAV